MLVAQARSLAALFERHGIKVPKAARDTLLTAETASAGMSHHGGEDLRAAIVAGKVNPGNVVELANAAALVDAMRPGYAQIVQEMDATFGNMAMQALRGDPGSVLDQLRDRFLEQAAVVVDGARFFTDDTYGDPGRVLAKRPEASATYAALGPAMAELDSMAQLVATVCRFDVVRLPAAAFFIESSPADGLPPFSGPYRWVALYGSAGVTPALNTVDRARAIVGAAQAAVAAASRRPKSGAERMRDDSNRKEASAWAATAGPAR